MKFPRVFLAALCCALLGTLSSHAQTKVCYVATQVIRERFPEAQVTQQRIESIASEWKKELEDRAREIENLEIEIKKNRLIWSDSERKAKEDELDRKRKERQDFANKKFGENGEYDQLVYNMTNPVESKIFAAISDIANAESADYVWDKSTLPLVYTNPKYDITVKVLERLGIQVEDLKKKQEEAIKADPRNQPKRTVDRSTKKTVEQSKPDQKNDIQSDKPKEVVPNATDSAPKKETKEIKKEDPSTQEIPR